MDDKKEHLREIFDITFNKGNLHKIILRCVYIKFLNSQDELFLKNVHCNIYLKFSIHETFSNINPFHPQTFNFKYCPTRRRKEREKEEKKGETNFIRHNRHSKRKLDRNIGEGS